MSVRSVEYLKDPKKALSDMVEYLQHDTCHAINGYDASKCADDC